jgi:hypothetical protein
MRSVRAANCVLLVRGHLHGATESVCVGAALGFFRGPKQREHELGWVAPGFHDPARDGHFGVPGELPELSVSLCPLDF